MSGKKGENKQGNQIVPTFLYGTAWKEEATENLVITALKTGFTGIDTYCIVPCVVPVLPAH